MGTTADTELVNHGERRDRLGRLRVPAERRRALLAAFRESGQTCRAFARREGLRYTTLCTWVQQEAKAEGHPARPEPVVRFAEVALPAGAPRGLEVQLVDGTVVRGERVEAVVRVVQALRG